MEISHWSEHTRIAASRSLTMFGCSQSKSLPYQDACGGTPKYDGKNPHDHRLSHAERKAILDSQILHLDVAYLGLMFMMREWN